MTAVLHALYDHGRLCIAGCDVNGQEVRLLLDPLTAERLADELRLAAERAIAHTPTRETREAFDDTECCREVERT